MPIRNSDNVPRNRRYRQASRTEYPVYRATRQQRITEQPKRRQLLLMILGIMIFLPFIFGSILGATAIFFLETLFAGMLMVFCYKESGEEG